jgi:hypothetical protein
MSARAAVCLFVVVASCSKESAPPPPPPAPIDVTAEERARAAAIIGDLKKTLVGALTSALAQGAPSAIEACHTMAPALAASLSKDGITVGRATDKPRNPKNAATGWQADALAELHKLHADKQPLAGKTFTKRLPNGRAAYAEPLVIQELCLACHGTNVAPEVQAVLAQQYPGDRATGYSVGDLRGVAWVELPAPK